jgi:hypothetical protein
MDAFWARVEALSGRVSKSKAINVNSQELRSEARALAQDWFRAHRPTAEVARVPATDLQRADAELQHLLALANGANARSSYVSVLKRLRKLRPSFEVRVSAADSSAPAEGKSVLASDVERGIVHTLERMLPDAAVCYRQVLLDIAAPPRLSYRGTATELREVVRETLDHLAPDADVLASPGFALEKGRTGPTMKQKARFILRARGLGESSRAAPEQAVQLLEDQIASLARSVYERGSASTHGATTRQQLLTFKGFADAVLSELLQIHDH